MSDVVMITGCSTGIGRDLARDLARNGYHVAATARNVDTLNDLPVDLKLPLDVTDPQSIAAAVSEAIQTLGRIDVLINNAGYGPRGVVEEIPVESVQDVFDVNVFGVIRMVQAVAPVMREQQGGRIINISSIAGRVVTPVNGVYSSTKFALEALSDALRWELAPFGISVVLVEPGMIRTNFHGTFHSRGVTDDQVNHSPYKTLYERIGQFSTRMHQSGSGTEVVTKSVLKAMKASRPKARYLAGVNFPSRVLLAVRDYFWNPIATRVFKF